MRIQREPRSGARLTESVRRRLRMRATRAMRNRTQGFFSNAYAPVHFSEGSRAKRSGTRALRKLKLLPITRGVRVRGVPAVAQHLCGSGQGGRVFRLELVSESAGRMYGSLEVLEGAIYHGKVE